MLTYAVLTTHTHLIAYPPNLQRLTIKPCCSMPRSKFQYQFNIALIFRNFDCINYGCPIARSDDLVASTGLRTPNTRTSSLLFKGSV